MRTPQLEAYFEAKHAQRLIENLEAERRRRWAPVLWLGLLFVAASVLAWCVS